MIFPAVAMVVMVGRETKGIVGNENNPICL